MWAFAECSYLADGIGLFRPIVAQFEIVSGLFWNLEQTLYVDCCRNVAKSARLYLGKRNLPGFVWVKRDFRSRNLLNE
jgi:hypothetical protein